MGFSNSQIHNDALPNVEDVELLSISKQYLKIIVLNKVVMCLAFVSVLVLGKFFVTKAGFQEGFWYIFSIIVGFCLLNFGLAILAFKKRKYAIREHDVIYAKGLLINSITTVPISRIQHIEESRSWLSRQFNLATLNLYTAGESGSDLSIKGLPYQEAKQINDFISSRINGNG
ncbi:PH domain-containing protein [uncultured Psychroserpens sp.]|uniref:PH domain-containing protein n=1 Tax=uncultured Psychroserpens sp. TaxID=255436 RepID=UPI0026167FAA|nr:PH domain-containing protein [uncultured Psychroserpens sp.]